MYALPTGSRFCPSPTVLSHISPPEIHTPQEHGLDVLSKPWTWVPLWGKALTLSRILQALSATWAASEKPLASPSPSL